MIENSVKYSIIIPALNEEKYIGMLLSILAQQIENNKSLVEIIVVDGGSTDGTKEICKSFKCKFIEKSNGRGNQLREGAQIAVGEIFIFLHADSILTINLFSFLNENFHDEMQVATFRMKLSSNKMLYKVYSFFTKFDSIFTTFGDQGIVVRKDFYFNLGGFANLKIMEDVDFFIRARKETKIIKFNESVLTSVRRFDQNGIIKNQLISFILILGFLIGIKHQRLYEIYYSK